MATFEAKLPEDIIKKLSELEQKTDMIVGKMLEAGAEIAFDTTKRSLQDVIGKTPESRSTGELVRSLGVSPVRIDRNGVANIKVGFKEPRKTKYKEVSNAMIANIIEYGKHGQDPRPFLSRAKNKSKKDIVRVMEDVFNKESGL